MSEWLLSESVLVHPMIIGEILMGSVANRLAIARDLDNLPEARLASHADVRMLVEANGLHGRGIGFVDAHLLASARLTRNAVLETRDKRLKALAVELGVG